MGRAVSLSLYPRDCGAELFPQAQAFSRFLEIGQDRHRGARAVLPPHLGPFGVVASELALRASLKHAKVLTVARCPTASSTNPAYEAASELILQVIRVPV